MASEHNALQDIAAVGGEQPEAGERPGLGAFLKYLALGTYFGVVLVKAEVVSWYRIQEMFHFQSFHMYGIIGSAIAVGLISVLIVRLTGARAITGEKIDIPANDWQPRANLLGGLTFGFGWALTGACPGPLYAILGAGYWPIAIAIASAMGGVMAYGYLRPKLPH